MLLHEIADETRARETVEEAHLGPRTLNDGSRIVARDFLTARCELLGAAISLIEGALGLPTSMRDCSV